MTRNVPIRAPAWVASASNRATSTGEGGSTGSVVACRTPMLRPPTLTGTHAAARSPADRPMRCGHASISSAEENSNVWLRRIAGHSRGDVTEHQEPRRPGQRARRA